MLERAAEIIGKAEVFIITAGAGMGVDSGLPDFRGNQGFWQAYPPYARLGVSFVDTANPVHFERNPTFGWGFYGHRLNLYRSTIPHEGFSIIRRWIERNSAVYYVITSNVDGQFQKAGFSEERIVEVHGSIHHLQCLKPCSNLIWPNDEEISVDTTSMHSLSVPSCHRCGGISRPNILMFGDWSWLSERTSAQESRFEHFQETLGNKQIAVIELGAGTAIPTIRATSERLGWHHPHATVVRINPREPEILSPHISLACNALDGLQKIDRILARHS